MKETRSHSQQQQNYKSQIFGIDYMDLFVAIENIASLRFEKLDLTVGNINH